MSFPIPQAVFDASGSARKFLLAANDLNDLIQNKFIVNYHELWGVADPSNGSIYSLEQMQAKLDAMGSSLAEDVPASIKALMQVPPELANIPVATQALVAAAALVQFITTIYPDSLNVKYHAAAFDYTIDANFVITVTGLKEVWAAPV